VAGSVLLGRVCAAWRMEIREISFMTHIGFNKDASSEPKQVEKKPAPYCSLKK
jgi:hypothetical protein